MRMDAVRKAVRLGSVGNVAKIDVVPDLVRAGFATDWYVRTFHKDLAGGLMPGEAPFDFYMRKGARLGHDPNPHFSEVHYRLNRPDVIKAMLHRPDMFGFAQFVSKCAPYGGVTDVPYVVMQGMRQLVLHLDRQTVDAQLATRRGTSVSHVDAYVSAHLSGRRLDPNPEFSETAYLACNPDLVRSCGGGRQFVSGYQHYLLWGQSEGRCVDFGGAGQTRQGFAGMMWDRVKRVWTHA